MCWSLPAGTPAQTQMGELHDNRHKVLGLQTERSPQGLPHHWAACCGESWNYQQTVVTAELLHLYTVKWLVCNSNDILCKCDMKVDFLFCQVTWLQEFKPNIDSALCWNTVKHQHRYIVAHNKTLPLQYYGPDWDETMTNWRTNHLSISTKGHTAR